MKPKSLAKKAYRVLRTCHANGLAAGFRFFALHFLGRDVAVKFRGYDHPVLIRAHTSDEDVAFEIFVRNQYATPELGKIDLILDLGGNVGYSAVYFAQHYPGARVVSYEPEPENFRVLSENTKRWSNITSVNKGVWWRNANLEVENPSGDSWEFRFIESPHKGIPCVGMQEIISEFDPGGVARTMVKMDIEGAEREIFQQSGEWLGKVRIIQMEIHGCWKEVFDRLADFDYQAGHFGETIIIRLDPPKQEIGLSAQSA